MGQRHFELAHLAHLGAGFLETEHFGVRFDHRASPVDLSDIPQRYPAALAAGT